MRLLQSYGDKLTMARPIQPEIREFILETVKEHPLEIGKLVTQRFGVSRTTASNYLRRLVAEGLLLAGGKTNARTYSLRTLKEYSETIEINASVQEDVVWREEIKPLMSNIKPNVMGICQYGFNEMLNNVIDHSESKNCCFWYKQNYNEIEIGIRDYGIGIFEKIRRHFNLIDRRQALLELSKGKLTSDSSRHTGEGIFFTSRMFDKFTIYSLDLYYSRTRQIDADWMIESYTKDEELNGTMVVMRIAVNAPYTSQEVFAKYIDDEDRFAKTHVPLVLAKYEGEQLVSRSQARRLLARVERFAEVLLDFKNVQSIGQPFADEIFRVFQAEHPNISIYGINTTPEIDKMIRHAQANTAEQPSLF
jgi:anti-sigma regulatory factor (Ser/Thr protein kinase)